MIPAMIGKRPDISALLKNTKAPEVATEEKIEIEEETSIYAKFLNKVDNQQTTEEQQDIKMENFFEVAKKSYDEFNKRAYTKGNGYKVPGFPLIEKHLEGVEAGMYLFSGESNSGKSAAMMNIMKAMCSCEENCLFGIYYSLDDSKFEIIPRIIAMEQSIPIGVASKPKRYEEMLESAEGIDDNGALYQDYLDRRKIGLDKLRDESNRFLIEDAEKIKNTSDIKNHIKMVKTFLKSYYEEQGDYEKAKNAASKPVMMNT